MWRAMFLAIGVYCVILGAECLAIEKAVMNSGGKTANSAPAATAPSGRVVQPPEWAPWSLISGGMVTVLYSFTLPRRVKD